MSEIFDYSDFSDAENVEFSSDSTDAAYPESYDSEWADAARRRPNPVQTAPRKSAYQPRPPGSSNYVTHPQFRAALARVSQQITLNGNAIKTVDGRVRNVIAEQNKQAAVFRKEMAERRKDTDTLRRELQTTRELSALLPLIAPPGSRFGNIASLLHLVPADTLGGPLSSQSTSSASGGSNLLAIAAIAMASGAFDR
ncbi:hypothetical protein [Paraburkholderia terrae]|uniref:Uncharacterized protein n=1 Tax=Paraburkholderia terrae TaxID=311230 RepID=A0A2I8EZA1_9BURK|nr:hypothetical protein [Paraburkholderia terrae]AUT64947.1 hypothetical protein C2L65_35680 [Paraburkholderia terrae]